MSSTMHPPSPVSPPTANASRIDNLPYGQIVIVYVRWILIFTAFILTIWVPGPVATLRVQLVMIFALSVANFYLHGQVLMKHNIDPNIIYGASATDLIVVTVFVMMNGGFSSDLFPLYYPAIMAFAVVFPLNLTVYYTLITAVAYAVISVTTVSAANPGSENFLDILIARVVILAAVAFCSHMFLRIEQNRRDAAFKARNDLLAEINKRTRPPEVAPVLAKPNTVSDDESLASVPDAGEN